MTIWIEIAKFLAGFVASDLFAHATFLVSKVEPKVIGIKFTNNKNKAIIAVDLAVLSLFLAVLSLLVYISWFSGL